MRFLSVLRNRDWHWVNVVIAVDVRGGSKGCFREDP